jgi:uncharacterized protein (TIGR03437 family)
VAISALNYAPGVSQTIKVTIQHPEAARWGFQITARLASDLTKQAGTFTVNDLVRVRCDTTPAQDAPCNGAVEFPEHNSAVRTDAGLGYTYSVVWTPPASDVGDVVFYAAGNAANGDGTLNGDRIYTTTSRISADAASVCTGANKPAITSVVNAASFGTPLSAGSLVTIFGTGFAGTGVTRIAGAGDIRNNSFPKSLACVAVEIDGKRAPITYVQGTQINAQVPATTSTGPVTVRVLANPDLPAQAASANSTITLTSTSGALFTFDGKSAAAQIAGTATSITATAPVKPGTLITLYGTGFGPTTPAVQPGDIATAQSPVSGPITVLIGGTALAAADVTYAGLSPGSISGLYQINAKIPASTPDGNATVTIQQGSVSAQTGVTIPVKN